MPGKGEKMSSFVISKSEYMKAAGFCAALAAHKRPGADQWLRIWDPVRGRVAVDLDFIDYFNHIYKLNAASVAEHYRDAAPESDKNDYIKEFTAAKKATARAWIEAERGSNKIMELILGFHMFSQSVIYQMDNQHAEKTAAEFLHKICSDLLPIIGRFSGTYIENMDFWGCFTI